jgi:hypothetical protein
MLLLGDCTCIRAVFVHELKSSTAGNSRIAFLGIDQVCNFEVKSEVRFVVR